MLWRMQNAALHGSAHAALWLNWGGGTVDALLRRRVVLTVAARAHRDGGLAPEQGCRNRRRAAGWRDALRARLEGQVRGKVQRRQAPVVRCLNSSRGFEHFEIVAKVVEKTKLAPFSI